MKSHGIIRLWLFRFLLMRAEGSEGDPRKCWVQQINGGGKARQILGFDVVEDGAYPAVMVTCFSWKLGIFYKKPNGLVR
jgi:hypothetical protein